MRKNNIKSILEKAKTIRGKAHVLVVGDIMLDRYYYGIVNRISPEAPVPVVLIEDEEIRPGGAANVAMNLSALGVRTSLIGCVGQDNGGKQLSKLVAGHGINVEGIVKSASRHTTLKTRIISEQQQMLRLDKESKDPLNAQVERRVMKNFNKLLHQTDIVIISDYAKGTLNKSLLTGIIKSAKAVNCPIIIDPKVKDYTNYQGATVVTPNSIELSLATGIEIRNTEKLLEVGQHLRKDFSIDHLIVTRGKDGISLLNDFGIQHFPAVARSVYDVSGAGDTVVATLAFSHLLGISWEEAIEIANLAAGKVIEKLGTVTISYNDLVKATQELE